ncbi:sensor histidine kinase [Streptomyces sp. NPDC090127]|uniref:sensor histidine kinase n=1 Tax=Streptomyces sp. NPDC090127 TaxID=3365953 RepID=UPI0037F170A2
MTTDTDEQPPPVPDSPSAPLSRWLQRQTQRAQAFDTRRPGIWDGLLTAFWTFAALVDATGGWRNTARDPSVPGGLILAMSLAFTLPLLWRRRRPMTALAVMAGAALVSNWTGAFLQAALLQMIVVFHLALRRPPRTLLWTLALLAPPLVVGTVRFPQGSWDQHIVPTLWAYAMVALLGIAVRSRKDHTAALVDRARRLEIERDQQAQLAAAAERHRIAREMHDIIGHNLSVITGLADGGRYAAAKNPERAAEALDAIGTTSRQALTELRRLLQGAAVRAPQPTLADLDTLLTGVRNAGLAVRLKATGDAQELPAGAQLTVYRVVQEALTNTLKHAGEGAQATVLLVYAADEVTAEVTNTGRAPEPTDRGGLVAMDGQGITGMRERAKLYEGTLEAGPLPGGGWRVRLRLPLEGSPS